LRFLRENESEYLYLVGDIVDGWGIKRSFYWNDEHNRILRAILDKSSAGTRVAYVTGNHDEFLRDWAGLMFGGIGLKNEAVHRTADGRALLVFHGDHFDLCIRNARWLAHLGDSAYRVCQLAIGVLNAVRRAFGKPHWSLADWLKRRVKSAISYVDSFENAVAAEARRRGFDGVVCGHIHQAALRDIDGLLYCNDGDWVDSCTALVEDHAGRLSLLHAGAPTDAPRVEPAAEPSAAPALEGVA
jgi:UDP-2,3-diacylglucosamine pyrophosphatase LpxH